MLVNYKLTISNEEMDALLSATQSYRRKIGKRITELKVMLEYPEDYKEEIDNMQLELKSISNEYHHLTNLIEKLDELPF